MRIHGVILAVLLPVALLVNAPATASGNTPATGESGAFDNGKPRLVDFRRPGDPGQRMNIRGRAIRIDGTPPAAIPISIRQANGDGTAIFLEESSVDGQTIAFGQFDIVLAPMET